MGLTCSGIRYFHILMTECNNLVLLCVLEYPWIRRPSVRPSVSRYVRAHEKTLVEYTWNSDHRLPHTHSPSKFLRFIVNENHNGINLICIFKENYKRWKYDLIRKSKGYCWVLVVLLDTFLTCKLSKKNINVGKSVRPSVRSHFQTSSPLKPLGQSKPNCMWSLLGKGERKFK